MGSQLSRSQRERETETAASSEIAFARYFSYHQLPSSDGLNVFGFSESVFFSRFARFQFWSSVLEYVTEMFGSLLVLFWQWFNTCSAHRFSWTFQNIDRSTDIFSKFGRFEFYRRSKVGKFLFDSTLISL